MPDSSQTEPIRQRIKRIIHRDLKLGDTPIADDMPFFQSEADLDSLDILLLVGSIEREFGLKIASEEVGRTVFENVQTLTDYVERRTRERNGDAVGNPATSQPAAAPVDYLARLPHAEPFRFVSEVTEIREGESAAGVWSLTGSEAFFAGHFPGNPIVPGVLVVEALAQLSGLAAAEPSSVATVGKLVHVDVRFEHAVTPPAELALRSLFVRRVGELHQFEVSASVGSQTVAHGTLSLHLTKGLAS